MRIFAYSYYDGSVMKQNSNLCYFSLCILCVLVIITTGCKKDNEPEIVKDRDGNVYHTVTIGKQVWMVENLKTTKYNDGTDIPQLSSDSEPGMCWYNQDPANKDKYGGLYNFYVVRSGKLCPEGWHVPSVDDWDTLFTYLAGRDTIDLGDTLIITMDWSVVPGKLKSTGIIEAGTGLWNAPNSSLNSSGFSAVPGGNWAGVERGFMGLGNYAKFWTSITVGQHGGMEASINRENPADSTSVVDAGHAIAAYYGLSVRCLKK
jgi:uncharacterized protein (TIGR02145 family)